MMLFRLKMSSCKGSDKLAINAGEITVSIVHFVLCLPPKGWETYCFSPGVRMSVCLSVCLSRIVSALLLENPLSYFHETSYKYQSTLDDVQSARTVTLAFIFFELFPFELCPSQNRISIVSAL